MPQAQFRTLRINSPHFLRTIMRNANQQSRAREQAGSFAPPLCRPARNNNLRRQSTCTSRDWTQRTSFLTGAALRGQISRKTVGEKRRMALFRVRQSHGPNTHPRLKSRDSAGNCSVIGARPLYDDSSRGFGLFKYEFSHPLPNSPPFGSSA